MTPAGRRRRQLAEIQAEAEGGDELRAADLAREHLAEFPDDASVLGHIAHVVVGDTR